MKSWSFLGYSPDIRNICGWRIWQQKNRRFDNQIPICRAEMNTQRADEKQSSALKNCIAVSKEKDFWKMGKIPRKSLNRTLGQRTCAVIKIRQNWSNADLWKINKKSVQILRNGLIFCAYSTKNGRSDKIWTCDFLLPNKYAIVFWLLLLTLWCFLVRKRCFPMLL